MVSRPNNLFLPLGTNSGYDAPLVSETGWNGERIVRLDVGVLSTALSPGQSDELRFHLFRDVDIVLRTQVLIPHALGDISWHGIMPNQPGAFAHLAVVGLEDPTRLTLAGSVTYAGKSYKLTTIAPGIIRIVRAQAEQEPFCRTTHVSRPPSTDDDTYSAADEIYDKELMWEQKETALIKATVLYPAGMTNPEHPRYKGYGLKSVPTHEDIWVTARAAADDTNMVFKNSAINARLDIISVREAVFSRDSFYANLFTADYANLVDTDKTLADLVQSELKKGADIVVMIVPLAKFVPEAEDALFGAAGSIPEPPYLSQDIPLSHRTLAISLALDTPAFDLVGRHVLAHELGHLLGAKHDRFTLKKQDGLYTLKYPYGYVCGFTPEDKHFCTVMGYERDLAPNNIGRIPYFSEASPASPVPEVGDRPIGVGIGDTDRHPADAAPFLRKSVHIMARYSDAPADIEQLVGLDISVSPASSGFIQRGTLGPLRQGSQVTIEAVEHKGVTKFDSWSLDGTTLEGKSSVLTLTLGAGTPQGIGKPRKMQLVANFVRAPYALEWETTGLPDNWQKWAKSNLTVVLTPAQPNPGDEVTIGISARDDQLFREYGIREFVVNGDSLQGIDRFIYTGGVVDLELSMVPRNCKLRYVAIPGEQNIIGTSPQFYSVERLPRIDGVESVRVLDTIWGSYGLIEGERVTFYSRSTADWEVTERDDQGVTASRIVARGVDKFTHPMHPTTFVTAKFSGYERAVRLSLLPVQDSLIKVGSIDVEIGSDGQDGQLSFTHSDTLYVTKGSMVSLSYSGHETVYFSAGSDPAHLEEKSHFTLDADTFIEVRRRT